MIGFKQGYYGWLGNQMFQYAAVRAIALRDGQDFYFPENTPNLFDYFNLTATPDNRTFRGLTYKEEHFEYTEIPATKSYGSIVLDGYFQSEKYFKDYEKEIREEFTFKFINDKIPRADCIGIHVRRGDYLKYPDIHPVCTEEYYREALSMLPYGLPTVIVSDDIPWCKETFSDLDIIYNDSDFMKDFIVLTKCRYHIIANSSFSWWGAWLAKSKKVIAPKVWFGPNGPGSDKDLIPDRWLRV